MLGAARKYHGGSGPAWGGASCADAFAKSLLHVAQYQTNFEMASSVSH